MMYKIGDKVLYPMNGAGVIEDIEEQTVMGKKKSYYVMKLHAGGMRVLIPMETCDEIGVRYIISVEEGLKVLEQFRNEPVTCDDNWNRRHRDHMQKIKTGDIYQVLSVVKNLMYMDRKKGLSTSERKMLGVAKEILVSEIVMTGAADLSDTESILADSISEIL